MRAFFVFPSTNEIIFVHRFNCNGDEIRLSEAPIFDKQIRCHLNSKEHFPSNLSSIVCIIKLRTCMCTVLC